MTTTFEGSVPITTEHLQKMAAKLAEAMQGLWAIIEDHGTDDMKKYRDEHLGALGIRMNLGEGCGTCPACMAEKEGPIAAAKKREGTAYVGELVGCTRPPTPEELKLLNEAGKGGKTDA